MMILDYFEIILKAQSFTDCVFLTLSCLFYENSHSSQLIESLTNEFNSLKSREQEGH